MSTDMDSNWLRESTEGVDAVLNRMYDALGVTGVSMAMALDVSPNTIKTWRRRGAVPMKFLADFAREHNVSLDLLQRGEPPYPAGEEAVQRAEDSGHGFKMTPAELALVGHYRKSQPAGMQALDVTAAALAKAADIGGKPAPGRREDLARGTEADPAWPQVMEWVYDALLARKRDVKDMPSGRKLRDMVTAVLVLLRVEEGEISREKTRSTIDAIL
ncbi:hypothetical protein GO613_09185 [Azoarcus communis]|uniref:helix-turn-helix domain-containing protein n=1 Tax=Parazoarcus communis TaxID=41977 RepID=UPI0014594406|nr:helix-turn-helix domain-containing protein [Parazoarcus communis]NMG48272.1 hypothetical protein [Parazoarcus communis]